MTFSKQSVLHQIFWFPFHFASCLGKNMGGLLAVGRSMYMHALVVDDWAPKTYHDHSTGRCHCPFLSSLTSGDPQWQLFYILFWSAVVVGVMVYVYLNGTEFVDAPKLTHRKNKLQWPHLIQFCRLTHLIGALKYTEQSLHVLVLWLFTNLWLYIYILALIISKRMTLHC